MQSVACFYTLTRSVLNSQNENVFLHRTKMQNTYSYVTYGTCYERSQKDGKTTVHISFGGLLMRATSEDTHLRGINLDDRVYCLVKKDDLVS